MGPRLKGTSGGLGDGGWPCLRYQGRGSLTVLSVIQSSMQSHSLTSASCSPCTNCAGPGRVVRGMNEGMGDSCSRMPQAGPMDKSQQESRPLHAGIRLRSLLEHAVLPGPSWPRTQEMRFEGLLPLPSTDTPTLPPQVSPEKCRCAVGSILSEGEESPSPELLQLYQKFGFKVFSFPAPSHVVTATFPYTTALSVWLAARRVHPALDAYIKVRRSPSVCVCRGKPG